MMICQYCRESFDDEELEVLPVKTSGKARVVVMRGGTLWAHQDGRVLRFCDTCCRGCAEGRGPMYEALRKDKSTQSACRSAIQSR